MDPFALIWISGVAVVVIAVYLVGRYYPGSGMEQLGMKSAREIVEHREELEADDLDQMLAAHNARRRAHGKAELTVNDLELQVSQEIRDQDKRRQQYLADKEIDQLLEATNARRRARGEPERTREDVHREFGQ